MLRRGLVSLVLVVSIFAQKKPVTIEAITAPRGEEPGAIVWAPDGKRFVYEEGSKVFLYDLSSLVRKQLLSLAVLERVAVPTPESRRAQWRNRRVREQKLQWSSSGSKILLAVKGDLFLFDLGSNQWEQLTSTQEPEEDPKLSPDGWRVAFRRGYELYTMDVTSRKIRRLTHDGTTTRGNARLDWVYPEELELGTAYWWSPDSRRIAYLQFDVSPEMQYPQADLLERPATPEPQRYPQAGTPNANVRLGVVAADGGKTRWYELGEPRDGLIARVNWLPDGRSLAVQRLSRVQDKLDLVRIEISNGKRTLIKRQSDPYWINLADDLRFLEKTPRFIWSSERGGFRHLYLYSMQGEQLSQLTHGSWEVTGMVGVDEAGERVFYTSTEESPLERQLYSVKFNGEDRRRLTTAPGTHQVSMGPTCEYYLDTFSSLTEPPGKTLHANEGKKLAVFQEADRKPLEEYEILPAEIIRLHAKDGALFYARLLRPAGFRAGRKYPAIVMVYGGPHAQTVRNAWRGADWDQVLAHRGFVVWQMDNRGSGGRGHAWETPLYRRLGARELADQEEGIRYLISLGFVDPARIGIHGWSYGGFMTLYALLHAPDLFQAGVAGAPVTDWHNYDTIYTERYLGLPSENEEGYRLSSPVHSADQLKARLLLIHNFEDDNVLFQNGLQMAKALEKAGKPFEMLLYPQKSHGVTGDLRKHLLETTTAFFERELKN
jgi:dipeptidyl-peptidase-4